MKASFKVFSAV